MNDNLAAAGSRMQQLQGLMADGASPHANAPNWHGCERYLLSAKEMPQAFCQRPKLNRCERLQRHCRGVRVLRHCGRS